MDIKKGDIALLRAEVVDVPHGDRVEVAIRSKSCATHRLLVARHMIASIEPPPLKVGDVVKRRNVRDVYAVSGTIRAIDAGLAWVSWATGAQVVMPLEDLERVENRCGND